MLVVVGWQMLPRCLVESKMGGPEEGESGDVPSVSDRMVSVFGTLCQVVGIACPF